MTNPIHVDGVPEFYVVFMTTRFSSFADVQRIAPEEPVCTMGVLGSYEDPRHYAENDSFVCAGQVKEWHIRQWANILGWPIPVKAPSPSHRESLLLRSCDLDRQDSRG